MRQRMYLVGVIAAGGLVCLKSVGELMLHPVDFTWFVLAGLTLVSGWATLRLSTVRVSFSISDTFTLAAALLFGPAAGTVMVTFDALMLSLRFVRRNKTMTRVLFNATAPALAMWLSAHLFFALTETGPLASQPATVRELIGPLAIFAAVYFVLNTGLVAVAVAWEEQATFGAVWREHFFTLSLKYFGGASIAGLLLLMMGARLVDAKTLVLILPLLFILYVMFKAAVDGVRERLTHLAETHSYVAALRSTADGVLVTDFSGQITLMNPAAERLTGWTERDARGRSGSDVFRTLDPVTCQMESDSQLRPESAIRERILIRADGTECSIEETHASIRDQHCRVVGAIRTFRDVSQRKALDAEREALLRSEQSARAAADTASQHKDEFLNTLSHELRTPATAILGWTRLLKSGRLDEGRTRHALDALERSARAQAEVLNDLLDMSRIVRGTLRLDIRRTDVLGGLREAVETVEPAMRSKNIEFRLDAPPDIPMINADPNRLRQVFWNLLSNAVKFTEQSGEIRVTVARESNHVRIDVSDNGGGIDPRFLPFIFDRFRQADSSTTRSHGGLGLGLAIVRHLVESHGGTVTAASDGPGRGARFTVRLPTPAVRRETDQVQAAS